MRSGRITTIGRRHFFEQQPDGLQVRGVRIRAEVQNDRPSPLVAGSKAASLVDGAAGHGLEAAQLERDLEHPEPPLVRGDDEDWHGAHGHRLYTSPA